MIAFGTIAVVVALHALTSFHPALDALYLLPAWLAYDAGGRRVGLFTLVFGAFVASTIDTGGFDAAGLALRLTAFLMVGLTLDFYYRPRKNGKTDPVQPHWRSSFTDDKPMVAVMIDCDGFSGLDDHYGSGSGQHVVGMLSKSLEVESRPSDMVARLSSSEFVLVLDGVDSEGAKKVMERVQDRFEQMVCDAGYECSISFGCAPVEAEPQTIHELLGRSDAPWNGNAYLN